MASIDQESVGSSVPGSGFRFVIGIDYGTTFTGVAWALRDLSRQPSLKNTRLVQRWGSKNEAKVPSAYTYTANDGTAWGYGIGPNSYQIRLSKLGLEPPSLAQALQSLQRTLFEAKHLDLSDERLANHELPRHLTKGPADVITDYLYEVAKCVWDDIIAHGDSRNLTLWPVDFVITHPAEWHPVAVNLTFQAVMTAFGRVFQGVTMGTIRLATEPEACAQYTLRAIHEKAELDRAAPRSSGPSTAQPQPLRLGVGHCVMVVDAGGGTIDLVTYRIDQPPPNLRMTRVTNPSGGSFGATLIDAAFFNWYLESRLEPADYQRLMSGSGPESSHGQGSHRVYSRGEQELQENFLAIKHVFDGSQKDYMLEFPPSVTQGQEFSLKITGQDLQQMFKHSVDGVIKLIQAQIQMVDCQREHVTSIVLSGGFSVNKHLHAQVQRLCTRMGIELYTPDERQRWSAVAQGAVLMGLGVWGDEPLEALKCPVHIGVVLAPHFTTFDHKPNQQYIDSFDQGVRAQNHIHWVVRRGDPIPTTGSPYEKSVKIVKKILLDGIRTGKITITKSTDPTEKGPGTCSTEMTSHLQTYDLEYSLNGVDPESRIWSNPIKTSGLGRLRYHKVEMQLNIVVTSDRASLGLFWGQTRDNDGQIIQEGYRLGNLDIPIAEA